MRVRMFLRFLEDGWLPIHYNYWLQSLAYSLMNGEVGMRVHDFGFEGEGRVFRHFTFSRLLGRYELTPDHSKIRFAQGCQWVISSPVDEILGALATGILRAGRINVGPVVAEVEEVRVEKPNVMQGWQGNDEPQDSETAIRIRVRTLSPIVAYSTLLRGDGSKYTVYFQPGEAEFQRLVSDNLERKAAGLEELNPSVWHKEVRDVRHGRMGEKGQGEKEGYGRQAEDAGEKEKRGDGVDREEGRGGRVNLPKGGNTLERGNVQGRERKDVSEEGLAGKGGKKGNTSNAVGLRLRALGQPRLHIIEYKGGIIKGYSGSLELYGVRSLLQLAVDAGLGSKNAQGFGCLELMGRG
ncbi:CRISPR associated protein Cas6 [Acididesulfobacillus acetoxydans]|uniref:CRISPR associated protein Cas6 n=1 Tax=Acididesulfobacillus acetoxydans TaxID=1561005 RepID=A0A8S0W543_9FIRM|nr:CRISPR-associated endoribonuclease Cas6 [Acididesulfobacillus acetoxydans]CAA7602828.1 CRISPR associated protein Cas6 [Acididesulfobacillus acetoxydans]CEJ05709.1 CRISPR associated protein Cas6 [Acididesulfobacillus acetoxydans]